MAGALSHLAVVELCDGLEGAACARQFAMWGARVIRVELPRHGTRHATPPLAAGAAEGHAPLLWEFVNAGKEIFTHGHGSGEAAALVTELVQRADVFITDWGRERLEAAELSSARLCATNPALVIIWHSPFGSAGPYSSFQGTDLIVQALSGFMGVNGLPEGYPLKAPAHIAPLAVGVSAFVGALAALWQRRASGVGQVVEVAALEAVAALVPFLRTQYTGTPASRQGGSYSGARLFRCRDGYIALSPHTERGWQHLLLALDLDEGAIPEPLRTLPGRRDREAVRRFVEEQTTGQAADDLFHRLNQLGVPCGVLRTSWELLRDPHLRDRGFFGSMQHPTLGTLTFPGPAAHFSGTPAASPIPARAYEPGAALRTTSWPTVGDAEPSTGAPLTGVCVVDLTQAWIGPFATMLLADLGAEVIKVESLQRPDVWRGETDPTGVTPTGARAGAHPWNVNANFNSVNRNKLSVALSLDSETGRDLFLQLVRRADLLIENYTPRVMENFGLAYERLRRERPDLVMVSFSGYGGSGPYRDYKANGATTECTGGWDALLGYPGGEPIMLGVMEADPLAGLQMAALALVALHHRAETGHGQRVDGSMFEAAVGYIGEEILPASVAPVATERQGNRHAAMAPHGVFPCAGEDEWIAIAVRDDRDWTALVAVAGHPELADQRFQGAANRLALVEAVEAAVGRWTSACAARALMERLQASGVPAGVVLGTTGAFDDPHFIARGWFKRLTHPDVGTHLHNGFPWRFSHSELVCRTAAPRLGEQSEAVLREIVGAPPDIYRELCSKGITGVLLGGPPPALPWVPAS